MNWLTYKTLKNPNKQTKKVRTTFGGYRWLCVWNPQEDWPATRQAPSGGDCKQSYSEPENTKIQNPNHNPISKRRIWITHIKRNYDWLYCIYFVKRLNEVIKLGQNLARGGGGAGHGFLSTMAESLRDRERDCGVWRNGQRGLATVCVSQFVFPTRY